MGAIVIAWAAPARGGRLEFGALWPGPSPTCSRGRRGPRRRTTRFNYWILTGLLLVDGVYLAVAMYATGGTQSPIRFVVYLHLVAVSLLASYRTGLKIALWHSLLLFVLLYAQAASLVTADRGHAGRRHRVRSDAGPQRHLVLAVRDRDLDLLGAQRARAAPAPGGPPGARRRRRQARRRRRSDQQSRIVLEGLVERFGFERGVLLGESDGRVVVLATHGTTEAPDDHERVRTGSSPAPGNAARSCRSSGSTRRATRSSRRRMPDARNVLVAPMIADGRPVGAIVVERRGAGACRASSGASPSMLGQFASMAALNLRNAVLLRHVQDLAERDSLTGAANRRMFQLEPRADARAAAATRPTDKVTAVLFIDLDDFKVVNDTLGHAAGDALLVAVTERISGLVRRRDLVARLGGDEFAS